MSHIPWLVDGLTVYALDETGNCNRFSFRVEGGYTYRSLGSTGGDRTTEGELVAVARLAAAAPELLACLSEAVDRSRRFEEEVEGFSRGAELQKLYERSVVAIAKATGNG